MIDEIACNITDVEYMTLREDKLLLTLRKNNVASTEYNFGGYEIINIEDIPE
jgi:hypothetical protein